MKPNPYHHLAALVRQKREQTMADGSKHFTGITISGLQAEAVKARTKHPQAVNMLAALMEEVGEVAKCVNDGVMVHELRKEVLHVAVVALRIVEEGGI